ncbi:ankyrin repeat-containing protein [Tieghemostelium lacteum]|uniref:Ankyrin repeat-containing protein n=1 Tax=Tieghemostelium lacteum TaxID=361077 RepID=A0A151Z568_TIELA|nr:ankyrin repeat-containing protein [Tieghemostelium lacteum]|eukprot:KYQ88944.1 ankyrin repeat-containing protein [Tieghemostelium lacteum]
MFRKAMDYIFDYSSNNRSSTPQYYHNIANCSHTYNNIINSKKLAFDSIPLVNLIECIIGLDKEKKIKVLEMVDTNGDTALTWIAANTTNYPHLTKLFDSIQKDCPTLFNLQNTFDETPLHVAVIHENRTFLDFLISKQVDGTIKDNRHLTAYDICKRKGLVEFEKSFEKLQNLMISDYQPQVFQWGQILASSNINQLSKSSPVLFNDLESSISQIAFGANFSMLLTDTGSLYSWGYCSYGKLGHQTKRDLTTPTLIKELENKNIKSIACGKDHSVALDNIGCVYVWGNGSSGRLGNGSYDPQPIPKILPFFDGVGIVQIACGSEHTLALGSNGHVYSWGSALFGKLGYQRAGGFQSTPERITDLVPCSQIACGNWFSVALSKNGDVFTFGCGKEGRLGRKSSDTHMPGRVEFSGQKIKKIVCGINFTLCQTKNNIIYGFGSNSKKLLNFERTAEVFYDSPTQLAHLLPYPINNLEVGDNHVLVLTDQGEVLSFGDREYGQIGEGDTLGSCNFTRIKLIDGASVFKISAGCNSSMMGLSSGHQQLGMEISQLLETNKFSDLRLCINNQYDNYIQAHKCIVASRCQPLHQLLQQEISSPNNSNSVHISQTTQVTSKTQDGIIYLNFTLKSLTTLSLLLRFIYTDHTPIKNENIEELGELAYLLKIERLTYICKFKSATKGVVKSLDLLPTSSLTEDFGKLATQEFLDIYSDIELKVHEEDASYKLLKSYKVFLSLRSNYFKLMFNGNFLENDKRVVDIYETNGQSLQLLLTYIYSNQVPSDPTECIDLLVLADLHQLPRAKELSAGVIRSFIDGENICYIYKIGLEYNVKPLIAWCESKINSFKSIESIPYFDQLNSTAQQNLLKRANTPKK